MALHRDIYWVGKQWAVTGFGVQACDQKQKSKFDIEASRLWEDGVLDSVRTLKWLNTEDFDRALDVARKHYPEPPRKAAPPPEKRAVVIETVLKERARKPKRNPGQKPPKPAACFQMRIDGWPAKFVPHGASASGALRRFRKQISGHLNCSGRDRRPVRSLSRTKFSK